MDTSQVKIDVHTIIIGAGPAGLAAAYALTKQGITPTIIEKDKTAGGLMRSIYRGEFIMDIGRKELYTRLNKVDALWKEILGEDYISYYHREGILYKRIIFEASSRWEGVTRGMSWSMALICGIDYCWCRLKSMFDSPSNYEDYWYGKRGKLLSRILSQRYEEKFKGINWRDLPVPSTTDEEITSTSNNISDPLLDQHLKERTEPIWCHPARGSGQICEMLEKSIHAAGAAFNFGANILAITTSGQRIETITIAVDSDVITYRPQHVVSSVSAEIMANMLNYGHSEKVGSEQKPSKLSGKVMSTICVYLFLSDPPSFPHTWLKITSPELKAGRITNFSAFNGRMVPKDMTCLCVEYFCSEVDPLLTLTDDALKEYAIAECVSSNLINRDKCFDHFVLKLPDSKAAINWRDWDDPKQIQLLSFLTSFDNLYYVNRPGTDKATNAGLEAASAIIANDRDIFFNEMAMSIPCWNKVGVV